MTDLIPITDLMQNKPYTKRLNMRNNLLAYKITKDNMCYIGSTKDIASIMKCGQSNISIASLNGGTVDGWKIERLGLYKKVFKVFQNQEFVFTGYIEDVAKKLFMTEKRVIQLCNRNIIADGQYMIKYDGDVDLVEMNV